VQLHGTPGDRLLLMDEPTSSLDVAHQHKTLQLVKELTREGMAALLILHDLNLVAQYADRVLVLGYPMTALTHPWLPCPLIVSGAQSA